MTRRAWFYGGLVLLMTACTPSTDNAVPKSATEETLASQPVAEPFVLREAPVDAELAETITQLINERWDVLEDRQKTAGIAVGVVKDDAVIYTQFWGQTRSDDAGTPITRKTMFNVHPANPFKLNSESGMFTPEGFQKAGVSDIAFEPDESFAPPHMFGKGDPNDYETYSDVLLPFEMTRTEGDLWANLDGVMRYVAANQPMEGLTAISMNNFEEEIFDRMIYGNGFTISVAAVPSQKLYVVILENSIDKGIDDYEVSVLGELVSHNMNYDTEIVKMKPLERQIYYELDEADEMGLAAEYQCGDGYRNFKIVLEGETFILKTDKWHSRISGVDTYEAGSEKVVDGVLTIDGAEVAYRLLDVPVTNMELIPKFDKDEKIVSLTLSEVIYETERKDDTYYQDRVIHPITTCKPVR
ncbi:MAG: hypothetical protein IJ165_07610 [Proteobacteria bacterium]|nr:hypothetical protein [Pseudomonadota bacterium]